MIINPNTNFYYKSTVQVPGDLFLYGLCVGLSEQIEQCTAEVVRVTVRVAQLVRDGVEEQISA